MNIAVIGGGITGLTAAYKLTKRGHAVTVFEKEQYLGGLAFGFRQPEWKWSLEASYHHLFTNDNAIVSLIRELGISDKLIKSRPVTANYYNGKTYQLDSPFSLLRFPLLPLLDKLRTGMLVVFCKLYPFWQTLEGVTAKMFFTKLGGSAGWHTIWKPLMTGKFGKYNDSVTASWLWARIHKRTPSLYYIEGGFQTFITALAGAIKKNGGTITTGKNLTVLPKTFDRILITVPSPVAQKLVPGLEIDPIPHLHAQTLILETDTPILDKTYWLNITDRSFPFLAVVAHTNFMDKKYYGNRHLTYIGNYLPDGHPYLSMTKNQLLKAFLPYILRLNPDLKSKILNLKSYLFTAPYAQPVQQLHYSKRAPPFKTAIPNVFLANMDSIYPWDRGTNYAVELGMKAAKTIHEKG